MEIPRNNTPELAQWYLERGWHEKEAGIWLSGGFLFVPILWILIPFSIIYSLDGRKKIKIGKAMNEAAGRENYTRPVGIPTNNFQRGMSAGPNTRYYPPSNEPPIEPIWD